MKKFINFILVIFFIFLILLAYDNKDKIYIFYRDNILKVKDNITIERNAYFKDNDYFYIITITSKCFINSVIDNFPN